MRRDVGGSRGVETGRRGRSTVDRHVAWNRTNEKEGERNDQLVAFVCRVATGVVGRLTELLFETGSTVLGSIVDRSSHDVIGLFFACVVGYRGGRASNLSTV